VGETPETPETPEPNAPRPTRQLSVSVRTLAVGTVLAALVLAVGVLSWLYLDARGELAAAASRDADRERAQQVAIDYAVGAARMDHRDLSDWKIRLVAGASPELSARLGEAADSMEQILTPLRWESTAKPVAAIVRSEAGDRYVVDAFVSVLTKTAQAPQGLQSTATYSITVDPQRGWAITDVGGIDAALGGR